MGRQAVGDTNRLSNLPSLVRLLNAFMCHTLNAGQWMSDWFFLFLLHRSVRHSLSSVRSSWDARKNTVGNTFRDFILEAIILWHKGWILILENEKKDILLREWNLLERLSFPYSLFSLSLHWFHDPLCWWLKSDEEAGQGQEVILCPVWPLPSSLKRLTPRGMNGWWKVRLFITMPFIHQALGIHNL